MVPNFSSRRQRSARPVLIFSLVLREGGRFARNRGVGSIPSRVLLLAMAPCVGGTLTEMILGVSAKECCFSVTTGVGSLHTPSLDFERR